MQTESPIAKIEIPDPAGTESPQIVEVELLPPVDLSDPRKAEIYRSITELDEKLAAINERVEQLNTEIDSLTNHADGLDYAVAVASGIIAGIIDSIFVGKMETDKEKIQEFLEEHYHTANDNEYQQPRRQQSEKTNSGQAAQDSEEKGGWINSTTFHRLDDLAHHPTPLGLVAAILVRYFNLVIFLDGTDGKPHIFFADVASEEVRQREKEQRIKAWIGAVVGGLMVWLANMAEKKAEELYDGELPEALRTIIRTLGKTPALIELLKSADTWFGHIMSDVSTPQGIPGVFLALLRVLSVLPGIRETGLPKLVKRWYKDGTYNLPDWAGVAFVAAKKQSLPVLINELLVRGFYFVRRLIMEFQAHEDPKDINWENTIPFGKRTAERMMTIASGTFVAFDVADAAIRSGGFNANCVLRLNFVGIGRFAVALVVDVGMGIKKAQKETERSLALFEYLRLSNIKLCYRSADLLCTEADMYDAEARMHNAEAALWLEAGHSVEEMARLQMQIGQVCRLISCTAAQMDETLSDIQTAVDAQEKKNPGLRKKLLKRLT